MESAMFVPPVEDNKGVTIVYYLHSVSRILRGDHMTSSTMFGYTREKSGKGRRLTQQACWSETKRASERDARASQSRVLSK